MARCPLYLQNPNLDCAELMPLGIIVCLRLLAELYGDRLYSVIVVSYFTPVFSTDIACPLVSADKDRGTLSISYSMAKS